MFGHRKRIINPLILELQNVRSELQLLKYEINDLTIALDRYSQNPINPKEILKFQKNYQHHRERMEFWKSSKGESDEF